MDVFKCFQMFSNVKNTVSAKKSGLTDRILAESCIYIGVNACKGKY